MTDDAAVAALLIYVGYLLLAFGLRMWVQLRRTGSTGFHGLGGNPGSPEWIAGALFAVALTFGFAAPLLALIDAVEPIDALDGAVAHGIGTALALVGVGATLYAQIAMGTSWRIGVDHSEKTDLVTRGPFGLVRNPIFAAMIPTVLGLTLMVPSTVAVVGFVGLILALELQVRVVEAPYLRSIHGRKYAEYAGQVGRFAPGIGLLR